MEHGADHLVISNILSINSDHKNDIQTLFIQILIQPVGLPYQPRQPMPDNTIAHLFTHGDSYSVPILSLIHIFKGLKQEIALFYGDDMKDAKEEITFYQSIQPSIKGRLTPGARFLPHMEVPQTVSKKILDFLN